MYSQSLVDNVELAAIRSESIQARSTANDASYFFCSAVFKPSHAIAPRGLIDVGLPIASSTEAYRVNDKGCVRRILSSINKELGHTCVVARGERVT